MFIDTIPNRKSPPAVLLRESYREGGRVKKRTLANLSKLPQALIAGIAALLDGGKVSGKRAAEPGFEIVRSLPHGHVAAVQAMIRKLGLERTLQGGTGVDKRVRNLIEAMIIQRIIAPGSKLAFHRALAPATATSSLALSVGLIDVAEREVYAALDWLIEQQTRIEAALAKKHLIDGTLVLYDVSSSYMEGRCCALANTAGIIGPTVRRSCTDCCAHLTARQWLSRCSRVTPAIRRRSVSRSTSSSVVSSFHTWRWSATAA